MRFKNPDSKIFTDIIELFFYLPCKSTRISLCSHFSLSFRGAQLAGDLNKRDHTLLFSIVHFLNCIKNDGSFLEFRFVQLLPRNFYLQWKTVKHLCILSALIESRNLYCVLSQGIDLADLIGFTVCID